MGRGSRRTSTSTDEGREALNINIGGSRNRSASSENHGRITSSKKRIKKKVDHQRSGIKIFYVYRTRLYNFLLF